MELELRVYRLNSATDSGYEFLGGVKSSDKAPVTLLPGASGGTAAITQEINGYDVKKFPGGEPASLNDGHEFVIGLTLFYVNNRDEAVLFADGKPINWRDAYERIPKVAKE
jgi:hypothetical protein